MRPRLRQSGSMPDAIVSSRRASPCSSSAFAHAQRGERRARATGGQELGQIAGDLVPARELPGQLEHGVLSWKEASLPRELELLQVVQVGHADSFGTRGHGLEGCLLGSLSHAHVSRHRARSFGGGACTLERMNALARIRVWLASSIAADLERGIPIAETVQSVSLVYGGGALFSVAAGVVALPRSAWRAGARPGCPGAETGAPARPRCPRPR